MSIGLPKGMTRDDAYVQGMADAEAQADAIRVNLAQASGACPGSFQRFDAILGRVGSINCPQCGMSVPVHDLNAGHFVALHTVNLACRHCYSRDVQPSGRGSVVCAHCKTDGKGYPLK